LNRSTFTEAHAMLEMKRRLAQWLDNRSRSIRVGTDSVTARALFTKGYASRSFDLNEVAKADRRCAAFARHQWSYVHVAGEQNTMADSLSRDRALTAGELLGIKLHLSRLLGDNPSEVPLQPGVGATDVPITNNSQPQL
jgi:hypothetical protein